MTLTTAAINRAIIAGTFTNDQLTSITDAVRFARSQLTQKNRRQLVVGTQVKFTNSKVGREYTGVVQKVAIKFITVNTAQGLWRVPASMLTVAE